MKKSELWKYAMIDIMHGELEDGIKLDVLEMMMDEMHMAILLEKQEAAKAEAKPWPCEHTTYNVEAEE